MGVWKLVKKRQAFYLVCGRQCSEVVGERLGATANVKHTGEVASQRSRGLVEARPWRVYE